MLLLLVLVVVLVVVLWSYAAAGMGVGIASAAAGAGALLMLSLGLLPESPRWLVLRGQLDLALHTLHRIIESGSSTGNSSSSSSLLGTSVSHGNATVEPHQRVSHLCCAAVCCCMFVCTHVIPAG
jgi:hypothetical protein